MGWQWIAENTQNVRHLGKGISWSSVVYQKTRQYLTNCSKVNFHYCKKYKVLNLIYNFTNHTDQPLLHTCNKHTDFPSLYHIWIYKQPFGQCFSSSVITALATDNTVIKEFSDIVVHIVVNTFLPDRRKQTYHPAVFNLNICISRPTFMKLGMNIMPLEVIQQSYLSSPTLSNNTVHTQSCDIEATQTSLILGSWNHASYLIFENTHHHLMHSHSGKKLIT